MCPLMQANRHNPQVNKYNPVTTSSKLTHVAAPVIEHICRHPRLARTHSQTERKRLSPVSSRRNSEMEMEEVKRKIGGGGGSELN